MVFYDFEVFEYNWLIVAVDMEARKKISIWDDPEQLKTFCENHKNDIWCGCNNLHYDKFIKAGILCGFNPKEINDFIIKEKRAGWQFSAVLNRYKFLEYDVLTRIDRGLKVWEGFLGNRIKESSVPFDINRPLTDAEKAETEEYCTSDVMNTIDVFLNRINDFDTAMELIKMFPESLDIRDIGLTKAQMSAKILECEFVERNDEFDLFVLPCIQIKKYREAVDFFMNPENHWYTKQIGSKKLKNKHEMIIAGLLHVLGWGGIHAGKEKYFSKGRLEGKILFHVDVQSFYPRLMIYWYLLTRNCRRPEKFKQIYDTRIALKKAGKKKEQAPYKIVINGTFGISKAKNSTAYDPRNANLICLNGQLMLIDLIEHLEVIEGFELIQSNTDGLIIAIPDTDKAFDMLDDICYEWEKRCRMVLEFDEIGDGTGYAICQKDVNNYVFKFASGKLERKGSYVKELSSLDYDLPIVNKALVDFMMNGIPVETTIYGCDDLKEFQMIKKIGENYDYISYNRKILNERVVRCFASKNSSDGGLFMKHCAKAKLDKIADTPEQAFLWNDSVNGVRCPEKLDKKWYVNLALKRLGDFGVT